MTKKKKNKVWANEVLPDLQIPDQSPESLRSLAKDIATNLVFVNQMIRSNDQSLLGMIFMPLALGALSKYNPASLDNIGMVYEYFSKAGPRSVNGYPMFTSCLFLNKHDADIVIHRVQEIDKMLNGEGEPT